ncbi:UDP-N-acetylmuramate dehydrogenase [Anaeromyxobacter diazotrophicus]|uniref:UDP-N-acetylenolpyruvoylglucosamine reductase n=1 Tax=Anaeromyxobacter diazotrophicus TaxID=2590199 RepID=A0A7I9VKY4_9BACT|nr:UDP-N-acetylmuramate dehydrogenase [Anaeromyxobacter diazotrophicus]GEJ56769.1 UDP-N-acetylenolpyruvoylglucosamine reductase [Anaeromyxobacter diazotrophicus]
MSDWRRKIVEVTRGEALCDAPLAPRTAVRVGGPADLLVRPADPDDLAAVLRAAAGVGVPVLALGGGANLLVADAGVRGLVVKLPPGFGEERSDGARLVLSAGAPSSRLTARAGKLGLVGCEFAAAIPGTLGGLVAMNAGTRAGEMKDVVRRVELATADGAGWVEAAALGFAYRTCRLPPGAVVTRVEVELAPGDVAASRAAMDADVARRRATQPLDRPTFGSTFRNPPGDYAGRLMEAVGLKGHRAGGAAWSEVHANFIVNLGGATARDVLALIRLARGRVRDRFGVELEPEVRLAGDFPPGETI